MILKDSFKKEQLPFLFLDTAYDSTHALYLADDQYQIQNLGVIQSSDLIHHSLYQQLKEFDLKLSQVKTLITIAGPGFYTGLRVAEGLAQTLSHLGLTHYSFYHHQWPFDLIADCQAWVCNGFKGQIFIAGKNNQTQLYSLKDQSWLEQLPQNVYSYSEDSVKTIEDPIRKAGKTIHFTSQLFNEKLIELCFQVIQKQRREEIFYFRSIQNEFKTNGA